MSQHEHADHPDFAGVVRAQRTPMAGRSFAFGTLGDLFEREHEHALLWADERMALTLFEGAYVLWRIEAEHPGCGYNLEATEPGYRPAAYRLDAAGLAAARALGAKRRGR